jgi:Spy/CpxP family protein refolding chaperone
MRLRAVLKSRKMLASATAILGVSVSLLSGGTTAFAQAPAPDPHAQHATTDAAGQNKPLADQIAELRVQVARLQAAVQQTGRGKKVSPNSGMKMSPAPAKGMAAMSPGGNPGMSTQAPADPMRQPATADAAGQDNQQLMNEIAELRAQVAQLQAAVQQSGPAQKSSAKSGMPMGTSGKSGGSAMAPPGKAAMPSGGKGMGMMGDKGEMGAMGTNGKAAMPAGGGMGMKDDQGEMGGMSGGEKASMPKAPADAMGMCCMGEMGGMSGSASGGAAPAGGGMAGMNAPASAMPGQPGASHLYHVGSTGFFLNHSQHITLTADQRFTLNRLKEKAMLDRTSEQRKIDQGEQELYSLTGADQLDNSKVQAKIGEIERLRAEQRMNFIQAVGEASKVLTHDQHQALMGTMTASKKSQSE